MTLFSQLPDVRVGLHTVCIWYSSDDGIAIKPWRLVSILLHAAKADPNGEMAHLFVNHNQTVSLLWQKKLHFNNLNGRAETGTIKTNPKDQAEVIRELIISEVDIDHLICKFVGQDAQ